MNRGQQSRTASSRQCRACHIVLGESEEKIGLASPESIDDLKLALTDLGESVKVVHEMRRDLKDPVGASNARSYANRDGISYQAVKTLQDAMQVLDMDPALLSQA